MYKKLLAYTVLVCVCFVLGVAVIVKLTTPPGAPGPYIPTGPPNPPSYQMTHYQGEGK